jgi:hypothetical protein
MHFKKQHNTTIKDYKEKFPDSKIETEEYSKVREINKQKASEKLAQRWKQIKETGGNAINVAKVKPTNQKTNEFESKVSILAEESTVLCTYKNSRKNTLDEKLYILSYLDSIFKNHPVENNYTIRKVGPTNMVEYNYISDISIPSLFINIEFPNSFWHNSDKYVLSENIRNQTLKENGWTVINIYEATPSIDDLQEELKKLNLL